MAANEQQCGGGDVSQLVKMIEVGSPSFSLANCVEAVNQALNADRNRSNKQLANIKGVRMNCSLILLG